MFKHLIAALAFCVATTSAALSAGTISQLREQPLAKPAGSYQVAQACGWYAISVCSKKWGPAQDAVDEWGSGYAINTSSSDFPNFRGGWKCAVDGPKTKKAARSTAKLMRKRGVSKSAYAKSAC